MSPYIIRAEEPRAAVIPGLRLGTLRDFMRGDERRPQGAIIIAKPKGGTARGGLVPADDRNYRDEDDYREPEACWRCHGEGSFHDCGEDSCCCLDPELDYMYACPECGGSGEL